MPILQYSQVQAFSLQQCERGQCPAALPAASFCSFVFLLRCFSPCLVVDHCIATYLKKENPLASLVGMKLRIISDFSDERFIFSDVSLNEALASGFLLFVCGPASSFFLDADMQLEVESGCCRADVLFLNAATPTPRTEASTKFINRVKTTELWQHFGCSVNEHLTSVACHAVLR